MRILICCWVAATLAFAGGAPNRDKHRRTAAGSAGNFDYYLLALSWSPEFCHSHTSNAQCTAAKPYGFVVHGLWPEYTSGGGPQRCGSGPGPSKPSKMLDIMPDLSLIQHEWTTHGTCSGLSADAYFALIRRAYNSIRIPEEFQNPSRQFTTTPAQIASEFVQANLKLPADAVHVACQGYYLSALEICLDKSLVPISCPTSPPCRAQSIRVPPMR